MASKAASVRFENVSKNYGTVAAVREVSFTVEPGALVTLLGPSGCGKTTTLRLIAGLEMPSSGRIYIADKEVSSLPATSRDVTMVFQSYALFPHMTVLENVAFGLKVSGQPKPQALEKAEQGLAMVGLAGFGSRLPSELSGGQQQRVAVARALVLEPAVLLFDEPLSNLDAKLRRRVRQDIRDLQRSLELTSVYVTHDQEEALAVSDRIIVMNDADIAQEGTPRQLYQEPADSFVADFIGDANLVDATIESVNGELAVVDIGGLRKNLPHRGLSPGPVKVALRPEAVQVSVGQQQGVTGEILQATYLGNHVEYVVSSALGELFVVEHRVDQVIEPGTRVTIEVAESGATLLPE
ncbi:MAG: ABC transporter ATP-binding protein [Gammaproteobacteria bacterium]|nr:ABC transporter ATP-binding protein [Gammaproteobacteria bacterium]